MSKPRISHTVARSARVSGDTVSVHIENRWWVTFEGEIFGEGRNARLESPAFLDLVRVVNAAARERRRLMRIHGCP